VNRIGERMLISRQPPVDSRNAALRLRSPRLEGSRTGESLLITRYLPDESRQSIRESQMAPTRGWKWSSAAKRGYTRYGQVFPGPERYVTGVPTIAIRAAIDAINEIVRPINYCYGIENRLCFFLLSGTRGTAPRDWTHPLMDHETAS
jgi:hypothetical protein